MPLKHLRGFGAPGPARKSLGINYLGAKKNVLISDFMLAINLKPVILICMIIKEGYEENHDINAEDAMSACMDQITEILIEPMISMDMVSEKQAETLGLIANALHIITRKAQAYEDMQNGNLPQEFRN